MHSFEIKIIMIFIIIHPIIIFGTTFTRYSEGKKVFHKGHRAQEEVNGGE